MIVKSILDTDLYKFTTSYAYMKLFPQAKGTFEFFDRDLTEYPDDFVQRVYLELGNLGMLHLTKDELEYMTTNCRFVPQVYWEWLSSFHFNSGKVQVWLDETKHLHITVNDYLYKVTLYEVPILAIVSELRSRAFGNECDLVDVVKRLEPKIRLSNAAGIPLIGRSLPIKNKSDEFATSVHVGEAFCNEFEVYRLERSYRAALFDACADAGDVNMANSYYLDELEEMPSRTPIANGNLQARCRMSHLYDIASRYKGLVMSTDNQTEYQLGFWTIHGDVGDFDPIQDLWKTEVYELAKWISNRYKNIEHHHTIMTGAGSKSDAIELSIALTPTDGLGISNSDLDQIGAKDYATVDDILSRFIPFENFRKSYDSAGQIMHPHHEMAESDCWSQLCARHGEDVVNKVWNRHLASEFKRQKSPIFIPRSLYA